MFHSLLITYLQFPATATLLDELLTDDATLEETFELDARLLTAEDFELELNATLELLLFALETLLELAPTIPNGAGCALQVLAAIQLLPDS